MAELKLNIILSLDGYAATVTGRNMFGGGPAPWADCELAIPRFCSLSDTNRSI